MQFKIKAGRFIFDKESKKVKVSKQKGLIHVLTNEEQQTHFKWANLQTNIEQFDIIVFPGDAVFEAVVDKKNTFVLRFGMDEQRYFFWLQDNQDPQTVVKEINNIINYVAPQSNNEMVDESKPQPENIPQPQHKQQKSQTKAQPTAGQTQPSIDFINKLAEGIAAARKKQHKQTVTALTHLSEVITSDALGTVLKQFSEQEIKKLIEFLPEEHQDAQLVPSTLRSPQFQQALDVLSDALNSQNALPLFMELGLNQQFLQKYYGVEAFLLAMIAKSKKQ